LRKLDSTKIKKLGWVSKIDLMSGLKEYCKYFEKSILKK
jgi:nucleoside-diphosphate-sugar epimerase